MATYYISPSGNDTSGDGSSGNPWQTLGHAVTHASSGDIIHATSGTFPTMTSLISVPVGVSVEGMGDTSTYFISNYVAGHVIEFSGGTNSGQSFSYINLSGNNLTGAKGLNVYVRSNVAIHHCNVHDFSTEGVRFSSGTNNSFYENDLTNCGGQPNHTANLYYGGQTNFHCYGNTITQTARAADQNGNCVSGYEASYGTKFYNNVITATPYLWDYVWKFAVEVWQQRGLEMYGNTIKGEVDMGQDVYYGSYDYGLYFHDNTIGWDSVQSVSTIGLQLEQTIQGVIICHNTFKNVAQAIYFCQYNYTDDYVEDVWIYTNKMYNIGITGGATYGWGIRFQTGSNEDSEYPPLYVHHIHIWNNTMVAYSSSPAYYGIELPSQATSSGVQDIDIRNNIIVGFNQAGIYAHQQDNDYTPAIDTLAIYDNVIHACGSTVTISGFTPTNYTHDTPVTTDPLFVDEAGFDFHLNSTSSSAYHLGTTVSFPYLGTDYDYESWYASTPSAGCYEYGSGGPPSGDLVGLSNGVATVSGTMPGGGGSNLATDLVLYWKLDETSGTNANDEVSTHDGTLESSAAFTSSGKINYGVDFVASTSDIYVSNTAITGDEISIGFWIRLDQLPSTAARNYNLFSSNHGASPYYAVNINMRSAGDYLDFRVYNTTPTQYRAYTANNILSAGTWYYLLFVCYGDGQMHKIYRNGVDVTSSSGTFSGTLYQSTAGWSIGNSWYSGEGAEGLDGRIDEFAVWHRALTAEEADELYNSGAGKQFPFGSTALDGHTNGATTVSGTVSQSGTTLLNSLTAYYKLDESSGVIYDSTTNNHDSSTVSATYGSTGKKGTCLTFSSSSDMVTLPDDPSWSIAYEDAITVSFWCYFNGDTALIWGNIFGYSAAGIYFRREAAGSYKFQWYQGVSARGTDAYSYSTGTWYHMVFVKNGASLTFYRNNSVIGTATEPSYTSINPPAWYIGGDDASETFNGRIDELGFWERALTASEVSALYNSGNGMTYPFSSGSVPDTDTFCLDVVCEAVGPDTCDLDDCFLHSIDAYFDPVYKGSKDRLSNFRNYGAPFTQSGYLAGVINGTATVSASTTGSGGMIHGIANGATSVSGIIESTGATYCDWFLPSYDELYAMYNNLYLYGVGNFNGTIYHYYWTSSEINAYGAWSIMFNNGSAYNTGKDSQANTHVRACRYFVSSSTYSLRSTGPAGGLIFYVVNLGGGSYGYYESAISDQVLSHSWSNISSVYIGTTSTAIGEGVNNSVEIISQAGHTDSAAKHCLDYCSGSGQYEGTLQGAITTGATVTGVRRGRGKLYGTISGSSSVSATFANTPGSDKIRILTIKTRPFYSGAQPGLGVAKENWFKVIYVTGVSFNDDNPINISSWVKWQSDNSNLFDLGARNMYFVNTQRPAEMLACSADLETMMSPGGLYFRLSQNASCFYSTHSGINVGSSYVDMDFNLVAGSTSIPTLSLNTSVLYYQTNGTPYGDNHFHITTGSSSDEWYIICPSWLSLSSYYGTGNTQIDITINTPGTNGTIYVYNMSNDSPDTIDIEFDNVSLSHGVLQFYADGTEVDTNEILITCTGGDTSWSRTYIDTGDGTSWCTALPTSGADQDICSISLQQNTGAARSCNVRFTVGAAYAECTIQQFSGI